MFQGKFNTLLLLCFSIGFVTIVDLQGSSTSSFEEKVYKKHKKKKKHKDRYNDDEEEKINTKEKKRTKNESDEEETIDTKNRKNIKKIKSMIRKMTKKQEDLFSENNELLKNKLCLLEKELTKQKVLFQISCKESDILKNSIKSQKKSFENLIKIYEEKNESLIKEQIKRDKRIKELEDENREIKSKATQIMEEALGEKKHLLEKINILEAQSKKQKKIDKTEEVMHYDEHEEIINNLKEKYVDEISHLEEKIKSLSEENEACKNLIHDLTQEQERYLAATMFKNC